MDALSSTPKHWTASFADPRLFQIYSLGILLAAGAYFRDFEFPSRARRADLRRRSADAGRVLEAYAAEIALAAQRDHHLL